MAYVVVTSSSSTIADEQTISFAQGTMLDDASGSGSSSSGGISLPQSFIDAVSEQGFFAGPSGPSFESWDVDPKLIAKK